MCNVHSRYVVYVIYITFSSDVKKNTRNEDKFCTLLLMSNECKLVKNRYVNIT